MWLYALIAVLVLVALGVQIYYARAYASQANTTVKVIWGVNIALLGALLIGVVWLGYAQAVK